MTLLSFSRFLSLQFGLHKQKICLPNPISVCDSEKSTFSTCGICLGPSRFGRRPYLPNFWHPSISFNYLSLALLSDEDRF